eukprot:jgi/Picsp_1/1637/NSC_05112-R2_---NA---
MNTQWTRGSQFRLHRECHLARWTLGNRRAPIDVVVRSGSGNTPIASGNVEEDVPSYFQSLEEGEMRTQVAPAQQNLAPQQAPPATSFWSDVPPLVWIGVGILTANVVSSALNFVKGGPQKMQQMAMEQMMKQMMKQAGVPPPGAGANPFGGPNPFGTMPGGGAAAGNPFGAGFPMASQMPASTAAPIDTSATPAWEPKPETTAAPASSAQEPAVAQARPLESAKKAKKNAFVDVDVAEPVESGKREDSSKGNTSAAAEPAAQPTFFPPPPPQPEGEPSFASSSSAGDASSMLDMLKNPEMQKMLYPYLPEPMRNPETFEWMLNSPEYRSQLEGMLNQQMGGAAPDAVQELMKDADMSPDKMKAQFDALGMSPEEFVQKVMSDPDLATSMTKPSVMAAIAECTKNPMSIFKYQNDEEVMRVFEKMSSLFPQAAGMPGMGAGGFPPQPPSS